MGSGDPVVRHREMIRTLLILFIAILLAKCSESGTWTDDPKNFSRAWDVEKPSDVQVIHSLYWRSPHFTREEAYYFQFGPNQKLAEGFISNNSMKPTTTWDRKACIAPPIWFAAGPLDTYEAWTCGDGRECLLLRDRKTAELYIAGCQL